MIRTPYPTRPARCDRKRYHAPKLRELGSVRALTLGSATIGPPDVKGTGTGRRGA